jgi:DNA-binding IclR family transcriptional regulator
MHYTIPLNLRLVGKRRSGWFPSADRRERPAGISASTISPLFATLEDEGFLHDIDGRVTRRRFSHGDSIIVAETAPHDWPFCANSARQSVKTCNIALPDRERSICKRSKREWPPLRILTADRQRLPFYCTASGKIPSTLPKRIC